MSQLTIEISFQVDGPRTRDLRFFLPKLEVPDATTAEPVDFGTNQSHQQQQNEETKSLEHFWFKVSPASTSNFLAPYFSWSKVSLDLASNFFSTNFRRTVALLLLSGRRSLVCFNVSSRTVKKPVDTFSRMDDSSNIKLWFFPKRHIVLFGFLMPHFQRFGWYMLE